MDLNIGMFTTANAIYWSQMPKIKDEIEKYADFVEKKLKSKRLGNLFFY